jgi:hypothetical protein
VRVVSCSRSRRAWTTTAIAAALLLAQLAAFLHHSTERHEVCEHGDLVHVPGDLETDEFPASTDGPAAFSAGRPADHGHCELSPFDRRELDRAPAPVLAGFGSPRAAGRLAPRPADFAPRVPLFRTAPKQSPPA